MERKIILDTETTGLDPKQGHRLIEIGAIEVVKKIKTGRVFHYYLNPERNVPDEAFNVHGISTEFLQDKPKFKEVAQEFLDFVGDDSVFVIHNAVFDMKFINHELGKEGRRSFSADRAIDTLLMARKKFPGSPANLNALCNRFSINLQEREAKGHGALLDAELLYKVYVCLTEGRQTALFSEKIEGSKPVKEKRKERVVESRDFSYHEDFLQYQKFMKKIKADGE